MGFGSNFHPIRIFGILSDRFQEWTPCCCEDVKWFDPALVFCYKLSSRCPPNRILLLLEAISDVVRLAKFTCWCPATQWSTSIIYVYTSNSECFPNFHLGKFRPSSPCEVEKNIHEGKTWVNSWNTPSSRWYRHLPSGSPKRRQDWSEFREVNLPLIVPWKVAIFDYWIIMDYHETDRG